jgi:formylglycine-generating enzyme required for sulfatase activity
MITAQHIITRKRYLLLAAPLVVAATLLLRVGLSERKHRSAWHTRYLNVAGQDFEFVRIPAGRAMLGSREVAGAWDPHYMELSRFWMSRSEVTVEAYVAFLNARQASTNAVSPQIAYSKGRFEVRRGRASEPVGWISFHDAQVFCAWLRDACGIPVRLPTEAEWEFAARGGIHGARYPWGWGAPRSRAVFDRKDLCKVMTYAPNAFGLYDMAGGVFEWCASDNATKADKRVARGGSWAENKPGILHVARRTFFPADYRDGDVGFRVVAEQLP